MNKFDFKQQLRNKYFWISVAGLIVLVSQQFGLTCIPDNFEEFVNSIATILVGMGILNNNATEGLGK